MTIEELKTAMIKMETRPDNRAGIDSDRFKQR